MGGIFGVVSKSDCVFDLFFGTDYHSHLGTKQGGMAVYGEQGFQAIHNIENSPFRTKFDDIEQVQGNLGIGCISDNELAVDRAFPPGRKASSPLSDASAMMMSWSRARLHRGAPPISWR